MTPGRAFLLFLLPFVVSYAPSVQAEMTEEPPHPVIIEEGAEKIPARPEISVAGGKMSVVINDAAFGDIITEIAEKAGFELKLSSDVAQKRLSTRFSDVAIQSGIQRMFSLISHKNYFIYYGEDGAINKVEVFGEGLRKPEMIKAPSVEAEVDGTRARTVRQPARVLRMPETAPSYVPEGGGFMNTGGDMPEVPFMLPGSPPAYIPPAEKAK